MENIYQAIFEQDGNWFIGYCPDVPGANGQGRTMEECRQNLIEAIKLIQEERRRDAMMGVPESALKELITVPA